MTQHTNPSHRWRRHVAVAAPVAALALLAGASPGLAVPQVPDAPPVAAGWERVAGTIGFADDLNDAGQVVGVVSTDEDNRGVLWDSTTGTERSLEVPAGATHLFPSAINARGQVAGQLVGSPYLQHAMRWSPDGTTVDLGTLGGIYSYGQGINDRGDVVGVSSTAETNVYHAFWWSAGSGLVDLGTLPGRTQSGALDVNDAGLVVGSSSSDTDHVNRAFVWTHDGGMVDLGTLGGNWSEAVAVNRRGEVVGQATDANGRFHLFRWTSGTGMVDLGTVGYGAEAGDINDNGTIVGTWTWWTGEGPDGRAFRWTAAGGFEDLGIPTGDTGVSWGHAINARGQVAGTTSEGEGYRGFLWQAGTNPHPTTTTTTTMTTSTSTAMTPTTTTTTATLGATVTRERPAPVSANPSFTG